MNKPGIDVLLDRLAREPELQQRWELDPVGVASEFDLTDSQTRALLDGDVESLVSEGLAERHVQQMRVSW